MTWNAQVPPPDLDEQRIALRRPHCREMADRPDHEAEQPQSQAKAHCAGDRAVHDGDGARSADSLPACGKWTTFRPRLRRGFNKSFPEWGD